MNEEHDPHTGEFTSSGGASDKGFKATKISFTAHPTHTLGSLISYKGDHYRIFKIEGGRAFAKKLPPSKGHTLASGWQSLI